MARVFRAQSLVVEAIGGRAPSCYRFVMASTATDHGTIIVEHTINVPVARAYGAFANAREREAWAAPSATAIFIYDETDFRVGGRDVARCGAKDDPRFRVETRYVDIIPMQRIVSTETIHEVNKLLAANVTTVEFLPDGQRTRIKVTVQVTSFVGKGIIDSTKAGHTGSLSNMAQYLEQPALSETRTD
jgi:uncharacterized protein YndB with AHSA1/START domain